MVVSASLLAQHQTPQIDPHLFKQMRVALVSVVISRPSQFIDLIIVIRVGFLMGQHVFQYDPNLVFERRAIQDLLEAYSLALSMAQV